MTRPRPRSRARPAVHGDRGPRRRHSEHSAKVPRVGPLLGAAAVPALAEAVRLGKSKLEEIHTQALADRDYLTATLTQFRLDLDHGVEDHLLVKSLW